jgi:hypothetical protein
MRLTSIVASDSMHRLLELAQLIEVYVRNLQNRHNPPQLAGED